MFPFQHSCELSFQTSDNVEDQQQINNFEDLLMSQNNNYAPPPGVEGLNLTHNINTGTGQARGRGRGRGGGGGRKSSSLATSSSHANDDDYEKKTIHREIERQRRLEMSNLYTSLRSILPAEYIKGKRAISDHVAQATTYIKDLEKNVKELQVKRDQLKSQESTSSRFESGGSNNFLPGSVEIRPFAAGGGFKIEINVSFEDEEFLLSSALHIVLEEGVYVASCSSTRVNERIIHSLVCEISDITRIDMSRLQQRLIDLVC